MEEIQNQIEALIDDIERDEKMSRVDLISALYKLKEQIKEAHAKKSKKYYRRKSYNKNAAKASKQ